MAVDPDLAGDSCIYLNPGASPHFWLSNDLQHVAPPPAGVATPGLINTLEIVVRHKANCALPAAAAVAKIDLWVCVPTASAINTVSGQTRRILDANPADPGALSVTLGSGAGQLAPGGSATRSVQWALSTGSTHPAEQAGHKCLIARAYPNTSASNETTIGEYAASLDQHYAQRNICIQSCNSPCGQEIVAFVPEFERRERTIEFLVFTDLAPKRSLLQILDPFMKEVKGFKGFATKPPTRGFNLEMKTLRPFELIDNTRVPLFDAKQILWRRQRKGFGRRVPELGEKLPFLRAQARLEPGQESLYTLETDLEEVEPGIAQIFHVVETEQGRIRGGLTVLMVKGG